MAGLDWALLYFLTVTGGLLLIGVGWTVWALANSLAARHWPTAPGRVLSNTIELEEDEGRSWTPKVMYTYRVGGERHSGHRIRFGAPPVCYSQGAAERIADAYPVEGEVTVIYDPERPSRSVLRLWPGLITPAAMAAGGAFALWCVLDAWSQRLP